MEETRWVVVRVGRLLDTDVQVAMEGQVILFEQQHKPLAVAWKYRQPRPIA